MQLPCSLPLRQGSAEELHCHLLVYWANEEMWHGELLVFIESLSICCSHGKCITVHVQGLSMHLMTKRHEEHKYMHAQLHAVRTHIHTHIILGKLTLTVDNCRGQDGCHPSLLGEELYLRVEGCWVDTCRLLLHHYTLGLRGGPLLHRGCRQRSQQTVPCGDVLGYLTIQLLTQGEEIESYTQQHMSHLGHVPKHRWYCTVYYLWNVQ